MADRALVTVDGEPFVEITYRTHVFAASSLGKDRIQTHLNVETLEELAVAHSEIGKLLAAHHIIEGTEPATVDAAFDQGKVEQALRAIGTEFSVDDEFDIEDLAESFIAAYERAVEGGDDQ